MIDQVLLTTSFHRQKEGRNELKRDATERRERFDTVNTLGFSAQAVNSSLRQRLIVGGEFYFDTLSSRTIKTDIKTGLKRRRYERQIYRRFAILGRKPLRSGRN